MNTALYPDRTVRLLVDSGPDTPTGHLVLTDSEGNLTANGEQLLALLVRFSTNKESQ